MELWLQLLHGMLTNVRFAFLQWNKAITWKRASEFFLSGQLLHDKAYLGLLVFFSFFKITLRVWKSDFFWLGRWRASLNWPQYQSGLLTSPWLRIIAIISGFDPQWDVCGGSSLLSRRNKAGFDTALLGIHEVLQKHCLPSCRCLKSPTREFKVSQEIRAKLLLWRHRQRHPRLAQASCHLCLVCHVYLAALSREPAS